MVQLELNAFTLTTGSREEPQAHFTHSAARSQSCTPSLRVRAVDSPAVQTPAARWGPGVRADGNVRRFVLVTMYRHLRDVGP